MNSIEMQFPIEWSLVQQRLVTIPQYSGNETISLEDVEISHLRPLCLWVRNYRLQQVSDLVNIYKKNGVAFFEPVQLVQPSDESRLVLPPIIEIHNSVYVIIDGLHRIYKLRELNTESAKIVVIRNVEMKLPAEILEWDEVRVTNEKLPREKKFRKLKNEYFREIQHYIDDE